jgi:hypothetical protein
MSLQHMKAALAVVWLVGALVFFRAALFPSVMDGFLIAAIGIVPPIVLWLWWNDPSPTMSESIQEARNGPPRRNPGIR